MPYLPGKFVWFECVTREAKKAQALYGEVLGWKVEAFPMGDFTYEMIKAGDAAVGGYATLPDDRTPPHWTSYLSVDDVDAAARKVTALGGKLLDAARDVPTVGRMIEVADPQGAVFHLYHSADGDDPDAPPVAGRFHWNELHARDARQVAAFYTGAFGYTVEPMEMGGEGTYLVLSKDGIPRAGITNAEGKAPPAWLPYVTVDDCDAAVARARRLSATILGGPEDIPNVGRFAVFTDSAGGELAVIKPAPR